MSNRREFLSFVAIGGGAAALNWAARISIDVVTSFEVAIFFAYAIAMTTAFLLNRRYVFERSELTWTVQYWRFFAVNIAALVQVFVISVALARFIFPAARLTWHADEIAHAIGLASPVLTSYWAHRSYSFEQVRPGANNA
jgi:putative flippase GtrA